MSGDLDCFLTIVICTFRRVDFLRSSLASWKCQTDQGFKLIVLHDGPDDGTTNLVEEMKDLFEERISFECTQQRFNDYGHSLREIGLRNTDTSFVLLTNDDNYYAPTFVSQVRNIVQDGRKKLVLVNTIHSYPDIYTSEIQVFWIRILDKLRKYGHEISFLRNGPYKPMRPQLKRNKIDIGSIVVNSDLAKEVGFSWRDYDADGIYSEELAKKIPKKQIGRIRQFLFVHN